MLRRPIAPLIVLAVAAASWGLAPGPAHAAGVAYFRLTNTDSPGAAPVTEAIARVLPPGGVVPADPQTSPLTILPDSTGYTSSGFSTKDLEVLLGNGQTPTGDPFQVLKLDFGPQGFAPGGRMYFSLSQNPTVAGMLQLVLPSTVKNLAFEQIDPPVLGVGSNPDGTTTVPEPKSALIWLALVGLGLVRAHSFRRARRGAALAAAA